MNCAEFHKYETEYLDGLTTSKYTQAIDRHRQECPACDQRCQELELTLRELSCLRAPKAPGDMFARIVLTAETDNSRSTAMLESAAASISYLVRQRHHLNRLGSLVLASLLMFVTTLVAPTSPGQVILRPDEGPLLRYAERVHDEFDAPLLTVIASVESSGETFIHQVTTPDTRYTRATDTHEGSTVVLVFQRITVSGSTQRQST